MKKQETALILGISGGLAQITAKVMRREHPNLRIIGVDNRSIEKISKINGVVYKKLRYSRNDFERLFRSYNFDYVYHLGRMTHAKINPRASLAQRLDLNVMGTNRVLELSLQHKVKKIVMLSTWHVYGAFPDNPIFIPENSLLRASIKNADLRDVVEMDQLSTNFMWKNQADIETVVFRPCSIIGPTIKNSMTKYLTNTLAPVGVDYNPMMQFVHEYDMAKVLSRALKSIPTGIYNVAPDDFMTIQDSKKFTTPRAFPFSVIALEGIAKLINQTSWSVPSYLIDYLKYPCLLSNKELKKHLPKDFFRFSAKDSLELMRLP